jgi:hypothetical protein
MVTQPPTLTDLYLTDETAWLEATARLVAEGRFAEVDAANLIEYLTSMAIRDRREVKSRLVVLAAHVLKWMMQPEKRSASWAVTIRTQQDAMADQLDSQTLRNHAESVFVSCYEKAAEFAALETGLPESAFSTAPPWSLDELLAFGMTVE